MQQTNDGSAGAGGRVEQTQSRRPLPEGHVAAPRLDVDLQGEPDDWLAAHRRRPPGVETGREGEDDAKTAATAAVRGIRVSDDSNKTIMTDLALYATHLAASCATVY